MIDPYVLFNAGLWLVFVVWVVALNLCRVEGARRADDGDPADH
jgi:hypothetical protein